MAGDSEAKISERIRELEVTLAAHLATCNESSKAVQAAFTSLQTSMVKHGEAISSLKADRNKVSGIAIAVGWAVAAVGFVSILLNVYLTIRLLGQS